MKYIRLFIVVIVCLLLIGCSKEKTLSKKCELISDQSANGYKSTTTYVIYYKDDVVSTVEQTEEIVSNKKNILEFFNKQYEKQYNDYSDTYGGYTYSSEIKNNKLISKVVIDYKKVDMKKFVKDNKGVTEYVNKDNNYTLDGIIKMYKNIGATCK